jgi:hypothetical protein
MVQQQPDMLWTINRTFALALGIVFILLALIGFFTPARNATGVQGLFNILDVDLVHNLIHLITGVIAIIAALGGQARTFNQVFGLIYLLLGLLGLFPFLYFPPGTFDTDRGLFLGIMHLNAADHAFNLLVGLAAIIVGFLFAGSASPRSRV